MTIRWTHCGICGTQLTGRQRQWCSTACTAKSRPKPSSEQRRSAYEKNKEKILARTRQQRIDDPEGVRERERARERKNKDKRNAQAMARYYANRDAIREKRRADYYARNEHYKALMNASYARRWEKDPDKIRARTKAYKERVGQVEFRRQQRASEAKRPEHYRELSRRWADENRERRKELHRAWKKAHRDKGANDAALRRARQRGLPYEKVDRLEVYERDDGWCYLCGYFVEIEDFHLDHVKPIVAGGGHTYDNVATTHSNCNHRKGPRLILLIEELAS